MTESRKEYLKEYMKLYYKNNKEKYKKNTKEYQKNYYENNKEKINLQIKEWKKNNKEKISLQKKEHQKKYINNKKSDPLFRLKIRCRCLINNSITRNGYSKKTKTYEILSCSYEDFKTHIELQFESWMNWDNYGKYNGELNYGWDIDHIVPVSSAITEKELIKLNHYTNLQPLCSKINRHIKKDNLDFII